MSDAPTPESDADEVEEAPESEALTAVHERAMRRFDSVAVPQQELREQSLEARRFVTIPGAMWEGPWGEQFENSPRPEVDKITKSLEKIETDYRENRMAVDYVPANDAADESTAELLDGLYRSDSYHFKAQQAKDNAFQEAIRGGFGAWRLTTEYADPSDPDNDCQRVNPGVTITDADQSVYFDIGSKLYDKSDAEWAFIVIATPRAEAEERWPGKLADWPLIKWGWQWDWYTPDVVRTAEYYEVEQKPDTRIKLTNKLTDQEVTFWASEIEPKDVADQVAQGWTKTTRKAKRRRVHKYLMNGSQVLKDCGYIAGDQIPIVPVYGRRDYVDGMERWRGHVAKKMDRQRIYNASVGNVVEASSLSPRGVPIFAAEQITPEIADNLSRMNIDRLPFVTVLPLRNETTGDIVSAGPIGQIEPVQVQPATAALLQISSADLTDDDDNADQVKANTSEGAMDIAASRVDAKSGIYLDNMVQSIQREGEIYQGMARDIYHEEGRTVETRSEDDQDGTAKLQQPAVDDKGVFKIKNDLSRGKYSVVATVTEATATKRQKTVRQNLQLASVAAEAQDQELAQIAILTAIMNMDGEGQADNARYARNKLIGMGVVKPTPEEQKEIEAAQQAAQGQQQQPSAADQVMMAQGNKLASDAKLADAKAIDTLAAAGLKHAQTEVLGGPDKAPEVPTGLSAANDQATTVDKIASADLKTAQAEHLRHGMHVQTIKTGAELAQAEHDRMMAERQHELNRQQAG